MYLNLNKNYEVFAKVPDVGGMLFFYARTL